jgi:hypothetical protein
MGGMSGGMGGMGAMMMSDENLKQKQEHLLKMHELSGKILAATDAGDLLPRVATQADHFECRFCPWAKRCWALPR